MVCVVCLTKDFYRLLIAYSSGNICIAGRATDVPKADKAVKRSKSMSKSKSKRNSFIGEDFNDVVAPAPEIPWNIIEKFTDSKTPIIGIAANNDGYCTFGSGLRWHEWSDIKVTASMISNVECNEGYVTENGVLSCLDKSNSVHTYMASLPSICSGNGDMFTWVSGIREVSVVIGDGMTFCI